MTAEEARKILEVNKLLVDAYYSSALKTTEIDAIQALLLWAEKLVKIGCIVEKQTKKREDK